MNVLIRQVRAKEKGVQKQYHGFTEEYRGKYLKDRGTRVFLMCSCFAIAGDDTLEVEDRCEFNQKDQAGLRAQRILPRETTVGRSAGYGIPWRVCKSGGMLLKFGLLDLFKNRVR